MNKQVEEIAKSMCRNYGTQVCASCDAHATCMIHLYAVDVYNAGYRKTEWISVDERFPERNGGYLTHCKIEGQSLVCILYCCKVGGFNEGTVTHWMPLPMPPKGDEGK